MEVIQGYVVLRGQKIFITVRLVNTQRYIKALTGVPIGRPPRMVDVENALGKINDVKNKLLSGKEVIIEG